MHFWRSLELWSLDFPPWSLDCFWRSLQTLTILNHQSSEKGVSNEVLGMCGASWLFQTVTNKHTYCARQESVVQVRVVAVEHGLRPPLKIRDMELVVQRTLSRYL